MTIPAWQDRSAQRFCNLHPVQAVAALARMQVLSGRPACTKPSSSCRRRAQSCCGKRWAPASARAPSKIGCGPAAPGTESPPSGPASPLPAPTVPPPRQVLTATDVKGAGRIPGDRVVVPKVRLRVACIEAQVCVEKGVPRLGLAFALDPAVPSVQALVGTPHHALPPLSHIPLPKPPPPPCTHMCAPCCAAPCGGAHATAGWPEGAETRG